MVVLVEHECGGKRGFGGTLFGQDKVSINSSAPGYRHRDTGALSAGGLDGYSWSSAVSGTVGVFLHFYTQYLNPSNAGLRAYGFQLRCLSE